MGRRAAAIRRVLWITLILNLAVAGAKLAVGYRVNSLGMIADGFHSVLDSSSNIIGLVGMLLAGRPPDSDHPYGHHKYESFSALGIALLLGLTAVEVVRAGIERLTGSDRPEPTLTAFAVMAVTLCINAAISRYETLQGRKHRSDVLLADAGHTRSDVFVSLSVIVGLAAAWMEVYWLDALVAFLIAVLILRIAFSILQRGSRALLDEATLTPESIAEVVGAVPGVRSSSKIRSRGEPPNLFIDLEVQLAPETTLREAHRIAHTVQDICARTFDAADVVVHMEPDESDAAEGAG